MPDCRRVVVGHCLGRGAAESELANQYPVTLKQPAEFDGDGASDSRKSEPSGTPIQLPMRLSIVAIFSLSSGLGADGSSQVGKEWPDQRHPDESINLNSIAVREKEVECMNG